MNQKSGATKILCIEDEHFISELYSRALTKAGYEVTVVFSGEDGLTKAFSDDYAIILLDIMIPDIDGVEVMRRLRGPDASLKVHSKIVITTNLDLDAGVREAVEEQADGYLIRAEITPSELVEYVKQIDVRPAAPESNTAANQ